MEKMLLRKNETMTEVEIWEGISSWFIGTDDEHVWFSGSSRRDIGLWIINNGFEVVA